MRIALVARRFDPAGGGTERDLLVTADYLHAAGHDVTVYASDTRGDSPGVRVRRVGTFRLTRSLDLIRFAYAAPAAARRDGADLVLSFARAIGADLLRSGGGAHRAYLRAVHRWRGRPRAVLMRLDPYHRAQLFVESAAFRAPTLRLAIGVSDLVRRNLQREFKLDPARTATLYNGVDLDRFRPGADPGTRREIRRRFDIGPTAPLTVFVGNGFGRKGLASIIRGWPHMPPDSSLLVVGNDRRADSYRKLAARLGVDTRISFAGAQDHIERIFAAADVLALPSFFEPFGNVALEAMATGIPALVSADCGAAEVMPPALRPYIVDNPSNPEEIAAKLTALLDHAADLGAQARAAAEQFTWPRYATNLLAIINSRI